jgi:hypothetical protein
VWGLQPGCGFAFRTTVVVTGTVFVWIRTAVGLDETREASPPLKT